MESVYLGLFEKVFNWVLSRILDPVYRFVSGLLMTIFSWLFEEILAPILMPVLEWALDFFIDLWLKIYSNHLYLLFSGLLKLIDYLETAFDVFIGLRDVTYTTADGTVVTGTLVEILMQQESISLIFWMITLGALGLALILTIYSTAKSAFDLDFENKRPVSKVMTAGVYDEDLYPVFYGAVSGVFSSEAVCGHLKRGDRRDEFRQCHNPGPHRIYNCIPEGGEKRQLQRRF